MGKRRTKGALSMDLFVYAVERGTQNCPITVLPPTKNNFQGYEQGRATTAGPL